MEGNQSTMDRLRRKEERSKNRAQRQVQLLVGNKQVSNT